MSDKNESRITKSINKEITNYTFETKSKWIDKFSFIQMADTQFGLTNDDSSWDIEIQYTDKCIQIINEMKPLPAFVIVCGDMVNAFPGAKNRKEQVSDFNKVFHNLHPDIPLLCVCGNHDIGNAPTPSSIEVYKSDFGGDYYKFWLNGVKFVVLNSQYLFDSSQCKNEAIEHEEWLNKELEMDENKMAKHIVVFQHIPWFNTRNDEEDEYFNLPKSIRFKWLDKFCKSGIKKVFAGHLHKNCGGTYTSEEGKDIDVIVTSAVGLQLGEDKTAHGYRIVDVDASTINHRFERVSLK